MITVTPIPFPIKSSMYFQKNCMISMNMDIHRVTTKGPANDFILKTYSRFKMIDNTVKEHKSKERFDSVFDKRQYYCRNKNTFLGCQAPKTLFKSETEDSHNLFTSSMSSSSEKSVTFKTRVLVMGSTSYKISKNVSSSFSSSLSHCQRI